MLRTFYSITLRQSTIGRVVQIERMKERERERAGLNLR